MREHEHRWKQTGPDEVACTVCGLEPYQRDQLDVWCELERRVIRARWMEARERLGLLG